MKSIIEITERIERLKSIRQMHYSSNTRSKYNGMIRELEWVIEV